MKFSGKVGNGPMKKRLNFGGDPVGTPVRRGLAEACTVPVLLLSNEFDYDGHVRSVNGS